MNVVSLTWYQKKSEVCFKTLNSRFIAGNDGSKIYIKDFSRRFFVKYDLSLIGSLLMWFPPASDVYLMAATLILNQRFYFIKQDYDLTRATWTNLNSNWRSLDGQMEPWPSKHRIYNKLFAQFFFIFILYYLNQNFAPLLQNVISKLGERYFIVCLCLFVFEQQRPPASSSEKCPRPPRVISSPPQGQPLNGTHRSAKFITCILQLKA